MKTEKSRTALVVGATGLVGSGCLKKILDGSDYSKVKAIVRTPLSLKNEKLMQFLCDFRKIDDLPASHWACDDVFCALGTTLKKAGSKAAFRRIDYTIPLKVAEHAKKAGARRFVLVSAMGAKPSSWFFYNQVKGDLEAKLKTLGFEQLVIVRPSLLKGQRADYRPGERLALLLTEWLDPLFVGPFAKYRPVESERVAECMIRAALTSDLPRVAVFESDQIATQQLLPAASPIPI